MARFARAHGLACHSFAQLGVVERIAIDRLHTVAERMHENHLQYAGVAAIFAEMSRRLSRLPDDGRDELAHLARVSYDDARCGENFVAFLRGQLCELLVREPASAEVVLHPVSHHERYASHETASFLNAL